MKKLHLQFKHTCHCINTKKNLLFSMGMFCATLVFAQPPTAFAPVLGNAATFAVFGGNAGITNQGLNTITHGSIGTVASSAFITGFHDGVTAAVYTETGTNTGNATGGIYTNVPAPGTATTFAFATKTLADANTAYNNISPAAQPGGIDPGAGELGGLTLTPGVYKAVTFKITNVDLTLDAQGDPNAVWVFQTSAALTVGIPGPIGARSVKMINGGLARNVFWYVGSAATINGAGGGVMVGTILAYSAITFSTAGNAVQTVLNGRALSLNASVTMVNTTVNANDTWTGLTSTAWETATNWSTGLVPVSTEEVLIPNVSTNQPRVTNGISSLYNLSLYSGAALTVTSNLQIGGFINNLGTSFAATSGTITTNGSLPQIIPASTFTNSNSVQNLIINNTTGVGLGGNINVENISLTNGMVAVNANTLTISANTTRTNGAINASATGGTVAFNGTIAQSLPSGAFSNNTVYNILLNNSNGLLINSDLSINNLFTLTNGILTTGNNTVIIANNASITGASATRYIDGNLRKVGNQAFTFPIGSSGKYAAVTISAPTNVNDHFTANYVAANPNSIYSTASLGSGLNRVSANEYWLINRTNGTSNVDVTLGFDASRSGGISTLADLRVASWNGTQWINQGNTGTTGTTASGTVKSNAALSVFGAFTLGSSTANNTLPLNLLSFVAQQQNSNIALSWQTSNEVNTSHFNVQRSVDVVNFNSIGKLATKGGGNYGYNDDLTTIIPQPASVYYRLQMVDNDGSFTYSKTVTISLNAKLQTLNIYPNPVKETLYVQLSSTKAEKLTLQVIDMQGKILQQQEMQVGVGNISLSINATTFAKGTYTLLVKGSETMLQKQFVKE